VLQRAAVSPCWTQQREQAAQEIGGSIAMPEGGRRLGRENDGFARIRVNMILHLDVLKAGLPKEDASGGVLRVSTAKQVSLELDDLW
jgi:hypothetical protein